MTDLVEHLAELTGFRDRDILDVTLVGALHDVLGPASVAIYRSIGEPGNERWMTRARLGARDAVPSSDPAWAELDSLPPIAANAARHQAFTQRRIVLVAGVTHISLFPVATDREVVGVLEIETEGALDGQAQRLVDGILRIFHNFQALLDYSERDALTGLLNRKTFDESFMKASTEPAVSTDQAGRAGPSRGAAGGHWLGLIDIDHFKRVNDNFGHLIGDEVLLLLARLMRSSFRFHDRLYRFGGEEFLVLMRCDGARNAAQAFERLRRNTEHYGFPQVGRITVSVGFTEVLHGDTPSAAIERAEKAVYYAKAHGRNQVQGYAELVARGELAEAAHKPGDVELF